MAIDLWRTRPYSSATIPLRQWVDRVFDEAFAREAAAITGLPFRTAENKFEALASEDGGKRIHSCRNVLCR